MKKLLAIMVGLTLLNGVMLTLYNGSGDLSDYYFKGVRYGEGNVWDGAVRISKDRFGLSTFPDVVACAATEGRRSLNIYWNRGHNETARLAQCYRLMAVDLFNFYHQVCRNEHGPLPKLRRRVDELGRVMDAIRAANDAALDLPFDEWAEAPRLNVDEHNSLIIDTQDGLSSLLSACATAEYDMCVGARGFGTGCKNDTFLYQRDNPWDSFEAEGKGLQPKEWR